MLQQQGNCPSGAPSTGDPTALQPGTFSVYIAPVGLDTPQTAVIFFGYQCQLSQTQLPPSGPLNYNGLSWLADNSISITPDGMITRDGVTINSATDSNCQSGLSKNTLLGQSTDAKRCVLPSAGPPS
ncbi:hypothetical protein WJX73_005174 [Symbiochloris irregularis]|uniref:Uncharacterized protein n=1 Tax=Symbiochloris irregularis TaxID=706552 RepID=A0AAW1PBG4_9CHLO